MDVRCNRCGTEYELDEARVAAAGTTVKCSNCAHIFKVLPNGEVREGSGAHKVSARQSTSETTRLPNTGVTAAGQSGAVPVSSSTAPTTATGEWMVRKVDGQIFRFRELTTLQKWIVERKVGREDEISRTARTWKKLGEIAELTSFFQVVEAADAAQRTVTASQMPQVHLTATPTGTFQSIPMPIPLSISHHPEPVPEPPVAPRRSPTPPPPPEVEVLDNDPVFRSQRRRTALFRTAVAVSVGLIGVAAIIFALKNRPATTLPPAVLEQVQLALQKGDEPARKVAMSALLASTVPAAPAVRARLQAEGARALREAIRLGDEAVSTAVANAAPGVAPGTPPPPPPALPVPAAAATTAERLLAEADAALSTLQAAGIVDVDADLAAVTLALVRGEAIEAKIADARDHARTASEAVRAVVDDERRLLLTVAEAARVDARDAGDARDILQKLDSFNDVRAAAAAAIVQIGAVRVARARALASTPATVVDSGVVAEANRRLTALPTTDPRRSAGTALVMALSTLPVAAAPLVVLTDPNNGTPNTPGTGTALPTTTSTSPANNPTTTATTTTPKVESGAALVKQGWNAIDAGRHGEAVRLFNKALSTSPPLSEAQFGLAEALRFAGRREDAVVAYRRYLVLEPSGKDANIARNALQQLE